MAPVPSDGVLPCLMPLPGICRLVMGRSLEGKNLGKWG